MDGGKDDTRILKAGKKTVSEMKLQAQIELLERKGFILSPVPLLRL